MRAVTVPVAPVGKPRMTQRDKWQNRPAVLRYRAFCDAVRACAMRDRFTMPAEGAHLVFLIPMPASWTKKKRAAMEGRPHQQKPDLDNCIKSVLDALLGEDATVWRISAEKRWSAEGRVEIHVLEAEEAA